ncbi:MAG: hypothetical protein J7L53_03075, partial [Deltaproteobacteria bacterium]|nr:hypothetical protein [Deltaproteobacteria bacterium]
MKKTLFLTWALIIGLFILGTSCVLNPEIGYNPSEFKFEATEGGSNPGDQILQVWNSGQGTLNWSVDNDATWLTLEPVSGISTGEEDKKDVTLSVDITGLSPGDYNATIAISDPEATNTPQRVNVSLTIASEAFPTIAYTPSSFNFYAKEGSSNPE